MDFEQEPWTQRFTNQWGKDPLLIAAKFKPFIPSDQVLTRMLQASLNVTPGEYATLAILNAFRAEDLTYIQVMNQGRPEAFNTPVNLASAICLPGY